MAERVTGRVLGPVELVGPGGVLSPSAGKQRVLLGGLLMRTDQVVSSSELIEWLWAQTPPATAKETLYVYLMRLRKLMREQVGGPVRLLTVPGGFRLDLPPDALDLTAYRAAVAAARRSEEHGDAAAAVERFRAAEGLWRGPALADVPSEHLQRDEVAPLTEERNRAVEDRIGLELGLGRHAGLLGELRVLTARHPLRERLWALLMRALHQDGRQAEALDCYLRVRALLLDTYGLEPGEELRGLQRHILRGGAPGPGTRPTGPTSPTGPFGAPSGPTAPALPAPPSAGWQTQLQLPPVPPVFVGRTEESAALIAALTPGEAAGVPVALVSGPPGIGKSALAVQVAHQLRDRFPDGQWYVQLDDRAPDGRTGEHIGDLLRLSGAAPDSVPDALPARAAALRARLAGRRVLLLVEDATELAQIRPLLPSTPGCAVLVTCRQLVAGLPGAEQLRLDTLDAPDAERMFTALVGHRATADRESARRIVDLCGGLPLALGIAAARLAARPDGTLAALAAQLARPEGRLDTLEVDSLSLRAAVHAAYVRLTPDARDAFRRIGRRPGGDVPPREPFAPTGLPEDRGVAEQLLRAGLLTAEPDPRTGEHRYRVHALFSAYAAELAAEAEAPEAGAGAGAGAAGEPDRPERSQGSHRSQGSPAEDELPSPAGTDESRSTGWLLMQVSRNHLERGAVAAAARSARQAWKVFTEHGDLRGSAAAARLLRKVHMTI
ncbi:BTAD domain-containing putative transcriptional regulator [Kitasatospora sp. NPDC094011]|uniref:AfsR/SARP family transcriptional regulator n=1 Tax=Kitasatospora sp. NPDC094011 TaxID=3364090 RepID=UPI0038213E10